MRHWRNVRHMGHTFHLLQRRSIPLVKNGTTATLRCYTKTFPDLSLKETTINNNYQSSLETASDGSSDASKPLTI